MFRQGQRFILLLIVAAYLVIGALYAVHTPPWQVPDEPAHYNYIAQVAAQGCCPVIEPGDWDHDYLERIKAAGFAPEVLDGRLDTVQYEDWQPPLYYLLASPVYKLANGDLTALRLFSVLIGAGVVIAAWLIVRAVFPAQRWLAQGVAAFVAFLPQHVAMMAGIGNDGLAELVAGLILLGCAAYVGEDARRPPAWLLGAALGIGIITKGTTYAMTAVIGLAILLRAHTARWPARRALREGLIVVVVALLIGGWWWLRNMVTYGGLDFMGQAAHDRVVVGQWQFADYVRAAGIGGWLRDGVQITFQSFWGQFGWMGVPMSRPIYLLLAALTGFAAAGALLAFVRWRGRLSPPQRRALILFGAALLLVTAAYLYYNLKFVQFQGRYLYPALVPIGLAYSAGLAGWAAALQAVLRARWLVPGVVTLFGAGMAAFALYALYRIVIPAF